MPLRLALSTKGRFYVRTFGRKKNLISGPDMTHSFMVDKKGYKIYSILNIHLALIESNGFGHYITRKGNILTNCKKGI